MANAKKCDLCEEFYDKFSKEIFGQFMNTRLIGIAYFTSASGKVLDLCPQCQSEAEDWFFNKRLIK